MFFFFSSTDPERQGLKAIVTSFAAQLCTHNSVPLAIRELYELYSDSYPGSFPSEDDLINALVRSVQCVLFVNGTILCRADGLYSFDKSHIPDS